MLQLRRQTRSKQQKMSHIRNSNYLLKEGPNKRHPLHPNILSRTQAYHLSFNTRQTTSLPGLLQLHHAGRWSEFLAELRNNDPKIYRVNKALIKAKEPVHTFHSSTGLAYEPA